MSAHLRCSNSILVSLSTENGSAHIYGDRPPAFQHWQPESRSAPGNIRAFAGVAPVVDNLDRLFGGFDKAEKVEVIG